MENAVDALKMAAAVMIFVLALSVSITAFSEARIASATLLDYKDRESSLGESDYYYSDSSAKQRVVGAETIIPEIYRAYNDYVHKVVFLDKNDQPVEIYKYKENSEWKPSNTLGLIFGKPSLSLGSKKVFIDRLLYGVEESGISDFTNIQFKHKEDNLYNYIKRNKFTEFSGIYYQGEENGISGTPDKNKQKIRVTTYKEN